MRIFEPGPAEGFEWIAPVSKEHYEILRFDGTPRRRDWKPILVERVSEPRRGIRLVDSDFPWLGGGGLALRERAREVLGARLEPYAELLPLESDAPVWAVNVTKVVDALDEDRSEVLRFETSNDIMDVKRYEFRKEVVEGLLIFKVPQLLRADPFVSEEFVELVEGSGLKGLAFRLLWESG